MAFLIRCSHAGAFEHSMELTVNLTTKLLVDTTESLLSSIYSELLPRDDMSLAFALHILQGKNSATCLRVIGDSSRLPVFVLFRRPREKPRPHGTDRSSTWHWQSGRRRDIVQACRNLAHKVHDKLLKPEDIDENKNKNKNNRFQCQIDNSLYKTASGYENKNKK
jgi:undecaprenyl pyrophosphate synthase